MATSTLLPEIPESNATKSGRDRAILLAEREGLKVRELAQRLEALGGELRLNARVSEVLVRGGQAVGVAIDGRWQVLRPVIDGGDSAAADYVARFRERYPKSGIVGLQVQARRIRLTPEGPVRIAPLVLSHYRERNGG